MPHRRTCLTALAILFCAVVSHADTPVEIGAEEKFPPSGLGATTVGERVLLYNDHTWKPDEYDRYNQVTAITDHGRSVRLTRRVDPESTKTLLEWEFSDRGGGPIQVLVSRAINTEHSEHSKRDNCVPVVTVRNLTKLTLFRIIAELEFTAKDGTRASTSVMIGPLDDGEEEEKVASPLLVNACRGLTARLHVAHCTYTNGLDCSIAVEASLYGAIPLQLADEGACD